ncbi:Non-specific lipid-transfer protein-like protein [Musa troglodytarum]|uniref:Non-specific lipid-transfer protein-like protein n=1 Tax=Musa troglodytarum TaxID=320322 RepID=A0A9E7JNG2_9LILI|nr:Non-specific lipid-transfer protein-like protein [Musa troglodytarum]
MQSEMARLALVAGLMAVYALSVSAAVAAPPPADCSSVVSSLLDCLPYVTNGSDTASPSKACCAGVATVVTQSPVCICQSLDEASNLGIALNITRVVGLPVACSVRAPKVHCDAASPPGDSPRAAPTHPSPGPSPLPSQSPSPSPSGPLPSPGLSPHPAPTTPPSPPSRPSPTPEPPTSPAAPPPSTSVELSPAPAADGAPEEAPLSDAPKLTSFPLVLACCLLWLYLLV